MYSRNSPENTTGDTVLILDDQATARSVLAALVRRIPGVTQVLQFEDPISALDAVKRARVDLVLSDFKMPNLDGIEFTRLFRAMPLCEDVPLVIVTSFEDRRVRLDALQAGATDFLTKPVDHAEAEARVKNLLQMRHQSLMLRTRADWLQGQVSEAVREIFARERETIMRLSRAGELRDEETGNHVNRMAHYSGLIAEGLGLGHEERETIEISAPLHDIGKIGISDSVLLKPGKHTPDEQMLMRQHTVIGHELLKESPSKYLQLGAVIALCHHEKYDGTGYPRQLAGESIPIAARIVAVADVFDALTSNRPYKRAWPADEAVRYLVFEQGRHFDPECVAAFIAKRGAVLEVCNQLRDNAPLPQFFRQ